MKYKSLFYYVAIFTILSGLALLVYFTFWGNFIQKGSSFNPEWLSQYGGFVGGFIGSLFSLGGAFLLFENLKQQSNQQFENIFFSYLNFHNDNVKALSVKGIKLHTNSPFEVEKIEYSGRKFFTYLKNKQGEDFWKRKFGAPKEKPLEGAKKSYEFIFDEYHNELSIYFRNLYNIFKFIKKHWKDNKIKKDYYDIVRAQLSKDELFLLYYSRK